MQVDWIKIVKIVASEFLLPLLVSFCGVKVSYRLEAKKAIKKTVPKMQLIVLDSKEKIKVNQRTIKECDPIIRINIKRNTGIDGLQESEMIVKFQKIDYKELERNVSQCKMLFIRFDNTNKDALILSHIKYKENAIYLIDRDVVPVHNNEANNYCFVCDAANIPVALIGKINELPVQYDIRLYDGDINPKIQKRNKISGGKWV